MIMLLQTQSAYESLSLIINKVSRDPIQNLSTLVRYNFMLLGA